MKKTAFRLLAAMLAFALVFSSTPAALAAVPADGTNGKSTLGGALALHRDYEAAPTGPSMTAAGMKVIAQTTNQVAPGVTYDRIISRNTNNQQNIGILTRVDLSQNVTLKASYNGYYASGSTAEQRSAASESLPWGFQSTTGQAAAYASASDTQGTVVMATNGDYFNMGTGEPSGYLIMEGNAIKATGEPYFAILKDGTAVIRDAGTDCSDVQEAISGPFYLLRDGEIVAPDDPSLMPRNSVGVCEDGSVVFYLNDGRQAPTSVGMTLAEVAAVLKDAGCHTALYLDGGGSATVAARKEGADSLQIVNNPSDGHERDVSSAMLVVSLAEATGVFHHASITPNDELYTPGSQIQFHATGVDTAGTAVAIPEGAAWALHEDSAHMGTITQDGLFTANENTGLVTVQLELNGECVGSTAVEIVSPDSIYFENDEISLGFEDTTDFGLVVSYKYRDVNFKEGDIIWTTTDERMGTFHGNTFTASDGESLSGTVTATSAYDPSVSGSIQVIVGMLPTIVWDFEDIYDENGNLVRTAEDYYGELLTHANYGRGGKESIEIVSIDDGEPVRFGAKSMKLNFDFTACGDVTEGAIVGTTEDFEIPGTPTGIGVWVYVPEGVGITYEGDGSQAGFWLRGYVNNGSTPINYTLEPKGVLDAQGNWNGVQPGIYWEGWMYLEADLTNIQGPYKLFHGNTFRLMFVHGTKMGTRTANSIYFDNLQFVYGTNVDDIDSPKVDSITIGNQELEDGAELTTNVISLRATFSDVQNKYTTGVDPSTVRMYIDGVNVVDNPHYNYALNASDGYAELYDLELLDGEHSVTVSLRDGFGNDVSETRYFTVNSGTTGTATTVSVTPFEDAAYLGGQVNLQIRASDASVAEMNTVIRLSNRFPAPTVTLSENYTGTASYNATNFTLTLSAQRKEDAAAEDGNLIATVNVAVPADLTVNDTFLYEVKSGSHTTLQDKFYTYSAAEQTLSVDAFLVLSADPILVGDAKGILKVTDRDGNPVPNAGIYLVSDGSPVGVTDAQGILETDYFSAAAATTAVYARNEAGMPTFHYNVHSYADGSDAAAAPSVILFNAVEDNTTSKSVTWLSSPLSLEGQSIRYRAKGSEEWTVVSAASSMLTFRTGSNQAVMTNSAFITGLTSGTTYEYQVGAGELWSEIAEMQTYPDSGKTSFFVMSDVQADDFSNVERLVSAITAGGYHFGIQTGDAIDNVTNFGEVDQVVRLLGAKNFGDADLLHVLGNHEYYGDADAVVASALYNLPTVQAGTGYSVTYGDVYVATIHFTNTTAELESALQWLVEDAQASDAVWKVLTLHQPPYYTNASGGNAPINALVPAACEKAGIDVVFSGHDHSLARTNPLTGGEIDEAQGILYYIGGSSGEKSYSINSQTVFDYEKIFALASVDFTATFIDVSADELSMTLNIYDVLEDGTKRLVDTYTLYTEEGLCDKAGHQLENAVYDRETGNVICSHCGMELNAVEKDYTGLAQDKETGRSMYLVSGVPQTGEFLVGEESLFFDENGVAFEGEHVLDEVSVLFENGKLVGGYTGFIKKTDGQTYHYQSGRKTYGWHFEGEDLYHFNTTTGAMTTGTHVIPDEEAQSKNAYYDFAEDGKTLRGYFNPHGYYYWAGLPKTDSWVKHGGDPDPEAWYRTNDHGHHVTDRTDAETVRIEIDGVVYTFDNSCGKLLAGDFVINEDGSRSYYWAGAPLNNGWFELDGNTYYAYEDGTLATGTRVIDGEAYMFDSHGVLITEGVIMTAVLSEDDTFMTVTVSGPADPAAMHMAVWSGEVPQEETLTWFEAHKTEDGTWTVVIPMCRFNQAGLYYIHAYATADGENVLLVDTTARAAVAVDHTYEHKYDLTCDLCGEETRDVEIPSAHQFRLYNPNTGEHFYTGSEEERDNLVNLGWQYEGVAFSFPVVGEAVSRLFDPATGEHLYTMDAEEIRTLEAAGWILEGVSFNSDPNQEVPQYRLHNPNATVGAYHFTGSEEERDTLISLGWEYQGIGWYSRMK